MKNKVLVILLSSILIVYSGYSQSVTLKQIGKAYNYTRTRFGVYFNGAFYSIDYNYALYKTDLSNGACTRLGNVTYNNTKYFFNHNGRLYTIENDGSMNSIDAVTGAWSVIASMGVWTNFQGVITVGNSFYAVENGAMFYYPTIDYRNRKQIGESEFYNLTDVYVGDTTLCTR